MSNDRSCSIREHNLLHIAFLPMSSFGSEPMLTFLWLSTDAALQLQTRKLSITAHSFTDASPALDVVTPTRSPTEINAETDFNDVPFSCPAARRVLPIPTSRNEKLVLIIGDEHSVLYSISQVPSSPRTSRRLSSVSGVATSPRANATRRSPQTEMVSGVGKRRKSSITRKGMGENGDSWQLRPIWRVRQGFGTVLSSATFIEAVDSI